MTVLRHVSFSLTRYRHGIGWFLLLLSTLAVGQDDLPIRPYASWSAWVNSTPYRIDAVRSGDTSRLVASAEVEPKVFWLQGLKMGVRANHCAAAVQQTQLGYVQTTRQTVDIWRQLAGDGYRVSANSSVQVGYQAFSMSGVGGLLECDVTLAHGLTITAGINQAQLSQFRYASYSGMVASSAGVNQFSYAYSKWGRDPYVDPALQSSGTSRATWLSATVAWKPIGQPLSIQLDLPVLAGRVHAHDVPYLTESLNLSEVNGQYHNNSGGAASGQYGNQDRTYRLPTFWRGEINYSVSASLSPVYHTQGVGAMRMNFVGNRWTWADRGRGMIDVLFEPSSKAFLLQGGTDRWLLGIGVASRNGDDVKHPLTLQWQFRYN